VGQTRLTTEKQVAINPVFEQIRDEIKRQDEKWGDQTHIPSVDPYLLSIRDVVKLAETYEIPTEYRAKMICQLAVKRGEVTWGHIAVEEMAEIIGAMGDEKHRRVELVQLAAVLIQWIHKIDKDA
jgi:hypothetical protein